MYLYQCTCTVCAWYCTQTIVSSSISYLTFPTCVSGCSGFMAAAVDGQDEMDSVRGALFRFFTQLLSCVWIMCWPLCTIKCMKYGNLKSKTQNNFYQWLTCPSISESWYMQSVSVGLWADESPPCRPAARTASSESGGRDSQDLKQTWPYINRVSWGHRMVSLGLGYSPAALPEPVLYWSQGL